VQAALEDGVVPGGGVTLARIKDTYIDEALKQPFTQLATNAGGDAAELLFKVQAAEDWMGFNLRDITEKPIDMYKEGILDPAKVVKQTVINACSIASSLITTNAMVVFSEKDNG
jgi:chaperonin GroEL